MRARRLALLTLESRGDYVIDDQLAIDELERRGHQVREVPWSQPFDPRAFDAFIVRTTWDYQNHLPRFLETLERIAGAGVPLGNSLPLIRWNAQKTYLRELEARGVPIVPSQWGEGLTVESVSTLAAGFQGEWVLKPVVSANAQDTFRLPGAVNAATAQQLVETFSRRAWVAQPMVQSVLTEGETSVFFFNGVISHAIEKRPAAGDFRVQEEHGGRITATPLTPELRAVSARVMQALTEVPLQARVDLVRLADGTWALMEFEAIEPSLYFRTDPKAAPNFADAVETWLSQ